MPLPPTVPSENTKMDPTENKWMHFHGLSLKYTFLKWVWHQIEDKWFIASRHGRLKANRFKNNPDQTSGLALFEDNITQLLLQSHNFYICIFVFLIRGNK